MEDHVIHVQPLRNPAYRYAVDCIRRIEVRLQVKTTAAQSSICDLALTTFNVFLTELSRLPIPR